jgi:capsule polysaccharide export protein KpsE/RkpR
MGARVEPTKSDIRHVRDPEIQLLVSRWRARRQELLAQAETMTDAGAQQTMREIAAKYERLEQQIEEQAGEPDQT